jgi:hypothetical protein
MELLREWHPQAKWCAIPKDGMSIAWSEYDGGWESTWIDKSDTAQRGCRAID